MQESEYSPVQITPDSENRHDRRPHVWARDWDLEDLSWSPHQVFVVLPFLLRPATFDLMAHKHGVHWKGEIPGWDFRPWASIWKVRGSEPNHSSCALGRSIEKHEYATPLIAFPESPFLTVNWNKMLDLKSFLVYLSLGENLQWVTVIQWVTAQP